MAKLSEVKLKCLRHRIEPEDKTCAICRAKRDAEGKFEKARRIFVGKAKQL